MSGLKTHLALFVGALALVAGGVVLAGLVSIKASSGHWPLTYWLLDFAKRRAVATQSLAVGPVPAAALRSPAALAKGARHFDTGCRPCHGRPGLRHPWVTAGATPVPPALSESVREWEAEELFFIVKHGIKFTGMPAWPALERDDEVWAMVAFLLALPELDAEGYLRLARGVGEEELRAVAPEWGEWREGDPVEEAALGAGPASPSALAVACARCHGRLGEGGGEGAFPVLAGQRPAYLLASLRAFAEGGRHSGVMAPVASGLAPDAMRELAAHYARLDGPRARTVDAAAAERGARIAERGVPEARVPSCADCHGPGEGERNPHYPTLAGQHPDYLVLQLELFGAGTRGGTPYAALMKPAVHRLTPPQMRDVAAYYASLPGAEAGAWPTGRP